MLIKVGSYVDSQRLSATITDAAIQTYLAVASPRAPCSDVTTNLRVFSLQNVGDIGRLASCQVFCGYHSSFTYNGMRIIYARRCRT